MRLTVTRRIVASLALVIAVAVTAILIVRQGLIRVVAAVPELAEVREPTYSASLEVELNVNGSVMAALDSALRAHSTRLIDLRTAMDHLLDEQIQATAQQLLHQPRRDAEQAASSALRNTQWLGLLVLLVTVTTSVLLTRSISRPVRTLKAGAEAVGGGDLSHRIPHDVRNRDELAELAGAFNDMVERLQSTTVSKELLERSERQLLDTVAQLKREIAERLQAEAERARLEASLRRSETMSAMGTLVAGVAHEVRNPLFGILSVLDAMEARFAERQEYQRYLLVLREQAERLNRLMRELLEYGKPADLVLRPGSVSDVFGDALIGARPTAERADVRLQSRVADDLPLVRLDRDRLALEKRTRRHL